MTTESHKLHVDQKSTRYEQLEQENAEMFSFINKWRQFNIEGSLNEQDKYDSELSALLKKAEARRK